MRRWRAALVLPVLLAACSPAASTQETGRTAEATDYGWTRLLEHAPFPGSYNFPVFVTPQGRFAALHPRGIWTSTDARTWTPSGDAPAGYNPGYLPAVQHEGAAWALGSVRGDYRSFTIDPVVRRTRDFATWQEVGRSATLPRLIFTAPVSFAGALWLLGGYDGTGETATVWRSLNGLDWEQVAARAPWSPRSGAKAIVFRGRLFLIGGGVVDGPASNDVWSSADGRSGAARRPPSIPTRRSATIPWCSTESCGWSAPIDRASFSARCWSAPTAPIGPPSTPPGRRGAAPRCGRRGTRYI
jgi:hypothetical protein